MTEQEMIYLYRNEHFESIRDVFYEKNKEMLNALTFNIFNASRKNIQYDNGEILSNSYMSFIKCLKRFDIRQCKYTFAQALAVINKTEVIKQNRHTMTNGNRIIANELYGSNQYETMIDNIKNSYSINDDEKINREAQIEYINKFLETLSKKIKMNIEMRTQGYSCKEISKKLHIPVKKIRNTYYYVIKKFIKLHQAKY
jgi:RNA polymerase sigma factor (sigma-70 family)